MVWQDKDLAIETLLLTENDILGWGTSPKNKLDAMLFSRLNFRHLRVSLAF